MLNNRLSLHSQSAYSGTVKLHIAKQQDGTFNTSLDIPVYKEKETSSYYCDFSNVDLYELQYGAPNQIWDKSLNKYVSASLSNIAALDLQNHIKFIPFTRSAPPYLMYFPEQYYELIKNNGLYCSWRQYSPYKYIDGDEYADVIPPIKLDIIFDPVPAYNELVQGITLYDSRSSIQRYTTTVYNTRGFGYFRESYYPEYDNELDAYYGIDMLEPLSFCAGDTNSILIENFDFSIDPPHSYYIANGIKDNISGLTQTIKEYTANLSQSLSQALNALNYRYCDSIQFINWNQNGSSRYEYVYNHEEIYLRNSDYKNALMSMCIINYFTNTVNTLQCINNELRLAISIPDGRDLITQYIAYLGFIEENQALECISIIPNPSSNNIFSEIDKVNGIAYNAGYWKGKV